MKWTRPWSSMAWIASSLFIPLSKTTVRRCLVWVNPHITPHSSSITRLQPPEALKEASPDRIGRRGRNPVPLLPEPLGGEGFHVHRPDLVDGRGPVPIRQSALAFGVDAAVGARLEKK